MIKHVFDVNLFGCYVVYIYIYAFSKHGYGKYKVDHGIFEDRFSELSRQENSLLSVLTLSVPN
jgi:hypothetical protein